MSTESENLNFQVILLVFTGKQTSTSDVIGVFEFAVCATHGLK